MPTWLVLQWLVLQIQMANQTGLKSSPHKGAYLTGLTNPNGQSTRSLIFYQIFYHLVLCLTASFSNFHSFFIWTYLQLLVLQIFIHFFIWTYPQLPVLQIFIHFSSRLILNCQFFSFFSYLDLPPSASLVVLRFYRTCLPDWTYTSDANLFEILWKLLSVWIIFSPPKVFLKLLSSARPSFTLHPCFRWEKDICLMPYANVMQCMILHERKCPCTKFISFILSLLNLPLSQTRHFTG